MNTLNNHTLAVTFCKLLAFNETQTAVVGNGCLWGCEDNA